MDSPNAGARPPTATPEAALERPWVIVNPSSAQGAGVDMVRELAIYAPLLGSRAETRVSMRPGHAAQLAREAAENGASAILAAGGDGTLHEVISALMELPAGRRPAVSLLPAGTGNDFARMLGVPHGAAEALDSLRKGCVREIDVGQAGGRWFINEFAAGLISRATEAYHRLPRFLRGAPRYLTAALQAIASHCNASTRIWIDGELAHEGDTTFVAVSNGAWTGGGFPLNPAALVDDGLFDLCLAKGMTRIQAFYSLPSLARGNHLKRPGVISRRGVRFRIESADFSVFELDGELLPFPADGLDISVVPGALRAIYGWSAG